MFYFLLFFCFSVFLSLEVITTVMTSTYLIYLFFVPRITSNGRRYKFSGELLSRNRFCAVTVKTRTAIQNVKNFVKKLAYSPGFCLTFFSFALSDLSNRRWSKKMINA